MDAGNLHKTNALIFSVVAGSRDRDHHFSPQDHLLAERIETGVLATRFEGGVDDIAKEFKWNYIAYRGVELAGKF